MSFRLCTLLTAVLVALLPEWTSYSLHPKLLHILYKKGFTAPTPIQAAVLPLASKNRDIIGIAQTVRFISILDIDYLTFLRDQEKHWHMAYLSLINCSHSLDLIHDGPFKPLYLFPPVNLLFRSHLTLMST